MSRLRFVPALAWRDSRTARRRLLTFMSAIAVGVAALVAIDSYAANVITAVHEQSRALLGADLSIGSREAFTPAVDSLLDSLRRTGTAVGRVTSFASMTLLPRTQRTHLVQVRAVDPGVPFYGAIETAPPGRWPALQQSRLAFVDAALLTETGARVGDTLALGAARFTIGGTLANVPGDVSVASALGPRVYIARRWLAETGLIVFGSRVSYEALLRLPAGVSADGFAAAHRNSLQAAHARARTVQETERSLTRGVDQLHDFLDLVGLVALLLGGIGVASAIHAYVEEKADTIAILRCLGGTQAQVLTVYLLEAAALGLAGAVVGAALGIAAQFGLPHVLGPFLPVDTHAALVPRSIVAGVLTGAWVATLFALLPLLRARHITPLQTLRRDHASQRSGQLLRDWPRLLAAAALAGSVVGIAIWRSGSARRGLLMSASVGAALLLLWLAALVLAWTARHLAREQWPFVIRQGVANLHRPFNQTRAVMLALGFGAFLLGTLYLVEANLLRRLRLDSGAGAANLAFFDVQSDQAAGVDSLIRAARLPVLQAVPIVPMRIAAINGRAVADSVQRRGSWALRREYRSSFRDTLISSETVVAGRWIGRHAGDRPWISVERGVAEELGIAPGDSITWNVQGVMVPTVVTSLREVNWARFEPNFFVIFAPRLLDAAPRTMVYLTHASDDGALGAVQHAVLLRYPNVSSIDLSAVQRAVTGILDRIALAVRFMALFSVATGILVLLGAVAASRRQRIREGVLLKTLGATRRQIGWIMLSEYLALGLLAGATGIVLSLASAWALTRFVLDSPFSPAPLGMLALAAGAALLTLAIGLWSSRDVFAETPMTALRTE